MKLKGEEYNENVALKPTLLKGGGERLELNADKHDLTNLTRIVCADRARARSATHKWNYEIIGYWKRWICLSEWSTRREKKKIVNKRKTSADDDD